MTRLRRWQERDEKHREMSRGHEFVHWLYEPAEWGRKEYHEIRWPLMHRIRLIPGRPLEWSCGRAERGKSDG